MRHDLRDLLILLLLIAAGITTGFAWAWVCVPREADVDALDAALVEMGSRIGQEASEGVEIAQYVMTFHDPYTGEEFALTEAQYIAVIAHVGHALCREMGTAELALRTEE